MQTLAYVILAVWLFALGGTLLNLLLVPRLRPRLPRRQPLVSVIVPARNEERTIARTVGAFLDQTWPALELVVVDDRSTDATGEILRSLARTDERVRVIDGEEPPTGWLGKPWALQQGSRQARGEILLFVDADVIYAPDALAAAVAHLDESGASMITLLPHFEMRGLWERVAMPNLAVVAFTFLPLWLSNRSRVSVLAIGGGTGNLIRRDAYFAAGGHEALRDSVVDDVALARLIRRRAGRTEAVRADHLVSVRMYHGLREIFHGFTKNAFAVFNRSFAVTLPLLMVGAVFHAGPYVLALLGDRTSLVTLAVIAVSRLTLFQALGLGFWNAILGHLPMMTIWYSIMLRSMWFTGVKGQLHWRGRSYEARRTRFGAD